MARQETRADREHQIEPETLLRECSQDSVGLALVPPISDRLDNLVMLAEAAGDRTNRKEFVAALILGASADGSMLMEMIRRYRVATAADTYLEGSAENTPVASPKRPGPRPRRSSSRNI